MGTSRAILVLITVIAVFATITGVWFALFPKSEIGPFLYLAIGIVTSGAIGKRLIERDPVKRRKEEEKESGSWY